MSEPESYSDEREQLRAELARIPGYIKRETALVYSKRQDGTNLIVNEVGDGPIVVHRVDCSAVAHQLDRALAWAEVRWELEADLASPSFVPHTRNAWAAKMPTFATVHEIERLDQYRACGTCQPLLAKREKRRPPKVPTTRLGSLGERHVGRQFVAADGEALGRLKRIRVIAEFEDGVVTSDDAETVSMVALDSDMEHLQALIREQTNLDS